jgi:hypothetical protein
MALEAVKAFWGNREAARKKQIEFAKADQGERAGVTSGKNMDGLIALALDIVRANGLKNRDKSPHFPIFDEFKGASYLIISKNIPQRPLLKTALSFSIITIKTIYILYLTNRNFIY